MGKCRLMPGTNTSLTININFNENTIETEKN